MQVLEEYAIESSISKVAGSETLDYCVDEGLQIFGGYGFHEDYPMARAYRDSRINRIFEGTNEINRMLIIQMLLKRAMAGTLPLIPAAKKLADELLAGPSFEEAPTGGFAEEEHSLAQAKKVFLLAAGAAVEKFRDKLAENQEIVAALSNIVMDVYAIESSLRRAQKSGDGEFADGRCRSLFHAMTRWIASRRKRARRSPQRPMATRSSRSSPRSAGSRSTRQWMRSRCGAALLRPCSRRIATHSKAAKSS